MDAPTRLKLPFRAHLRRLEAGVLSEDNLYHTSQQLSFYFQQVPMNHHPDDTVHLTFHLSLRDPNWVQIDVVMEIHSKTEEQYDLLYP